MNPPGRLPTHAVMGAYATAGELVNAVKLAKARGFAALDTATPCPVEELNELLDLQPSPVRWFMLAAGLAGAAGGLLLQVATNVWDYPFLVGGRPLLSWPLFVPVAFELAILCSAVTGFIVLLRLLGLPRLHHPVFNHPHIARATSDRFFLALLAEPATFDARAARRLLEFTNAEFILEVPK